jgi:hypothetical protein
LTGGAALAGVHLGHRVTRDLDLFWHGTGQLGDLPRAVQERLRSAGLEVSVLQSAPAFHRLRASDGNAVCVVDLVADEAPVVEAPEIITAAGTTLAVDTQHEILVNKLCALLSRSELRDLQDVQALVAAGTSVDRALVDAPRKDAGFSPLTLAWVLKELGIEAVAGASGLPRELTDQLVSFRDWLVDHLVASAAPEQ